MNSKIGLVLAWVGVFGFSVTAGMADEVTGSITETAHGSFKLNDGDLTRLFRLDSKTSQYEPGTWRPTLGDETKVDFIVVPGRRGVASLTVVKATLVKAGPNTPVGLESPLAAELVEVGRSGVRARIASGHVIKFTPGRGVAYIPPGWVPMIGEKVTIDFRAEPQGFGVDYIIQQMAKVRKNPAPEPASAPAAFESSEPAPTPTP